MNPGDARQLCLECGLCCNGVIFARGQLQPGDDPARLAALGLRLLPGRKPPVVGSRSKSEIRSPKFVQPCAAFTDCRCAIYPERPQYCRAFECRLLRSVQSGSLEAEAARRVIRTALRRTGTVRRLLRELGDADEAAALSLRFRRMKRRIESGVLNDETADLFGRLTLAVHDLNLLLGEAFYPGPGSQ